jgi:hypothetical protein
MVALLRRIRFMSRAAKAAVTGALIVLMFGGAVAADFWISEYTALHTARQLCGIINLVTKVPIPKPADPKANPSREQNYLQYLEFEVVKRDYRC